MSGAISGTTLAIMGGVSAAAGVGSALIGSSAAKSAAATQAQGALSAQQLQAQEAQNALDFNKQQYNTSQQQQAPWLAAGQSGLNALQYGMGTGGTANGSGVAQGSLTQPYGQTFTAPTGLTEQNDPGYQARLALGTDAIQKSAAARGSVVTGGTAKALDTYGQDYASNEYGNVYNRALNTFNSNQNTYNTNQTNQYNKLAALSNSGQQTATALAQQGQNAANTASNIDLTTGAQQGQDLQNAATATASGTVGAANAWSNGLSGIGNNISNLAMIQAMSGTGYSNNPNQTGNMGNNPNWLANHASGLAS
jgi:hypothetical protein